VQPATVYLNAQGNGVITPGLISTGSTGACSNITATVNPSTVACNDVGPVTVTLTVTNTNNNQMLSCSTTVTVVDSIRPMITCPANLNFTCANFNPNTNFGNATATDNCQASVMITVLPISNLNQCNVGSITRTFTARDGSNNIRQCVQVITVANNNPVTLANITFPPDITISNCAGGTTPPFTGGVPVVNTSAASCSDIFVTFTDDAAAQNPLCRDTIFRTWTVIDSCQLVPNTNQGRFTRIQRIVVQPQIPVISGPTQINLFISPVTCTAVLAATNLHSATGCNLILSNSRNNLPSFNISGTYPIGNTPVRLIARETCFNLRDTLDLIVTVTDTTETSYACVKTFPTILDLNPPMAFDTASNHANITIGCANPQSIRVSFSRTNINDTIDVYGCDDLLIDHTIKVYFWVGGVLTDSCTTLTTPTDPNDICTNNASSSRIAGNIHTENNQKIPNVLVDLQGADVADPKTGMDGRYTFPLMENGGKYTIVPTRKDNPQDGVSTLDLIMIQRHILKLAPLTSPYKIIAADINHDDKVTAIDIVELRKLILGVYTQFPNNDSWRMIDESFVFPDPKNPFTTTIKEKYQIDPLNGNMTINWVGVKIGDVNDTYVTNINNPIESRARDLSFTIEDRDLQVGTQEMEVKASANATLTGFQTAIHVGDVDHIEILPATMQIKASDYTIDERGTLLISWIDQDGVSTRDGEVLFTIRVNNTRKQSVSEMISSASDIRSEAYDLDLAIRTLGVKVVTPESAPFTIVGNTPNPWSTHTDIKFTLPHAGDVKLTVRDLTGRVLFTQAVQGVSGLNTINLHADRLQGAAGVLIYDLGFGDQTLTAKMLNIK
jgi:hypothetical protein